MQGSVYKPRKATDLEAAFLLFDGQGVAASMPAGAATNLDYLMLDDHIMTGAWLVVSGATLGDSIKFQVVDVAGTYYPAGTVLNQFITNFYPPVECETQFDMLYPAKVVTGLTLRLIYTSTGATPVWVASNYKLHKVLI